MFNCSKLLQAALALAPLASGLIYEMQGDDRPDDFFPLRDFTIVNFYDSSEESKKINEIFEGARKYALNKIATEAWHSRDIQWMKVNIEENPHLAFDKRGPTQIVYSNEVRLSQNIDWEVDPNADIEKEIEIFALIVRELTGEWIHFVECDQIQAPTRYFYDELVFFGTAEDLDFGGIADNLITLSMVDRYNFHEQRVMFLYNDELSCREEFNLDPSKNWVVMFNGENSVPAAWEYEDNEPIDFEKLLFLINTSVVKGTPKWGQRAHAAIFDLMQNGIVYMMPDLPTPEELSQDWKVQLMSRITEMTQEDDTSFVPIVHVANMPNPYVADLVEMLSIDVNDLPNFYVLHPMTDQLVKYPDPLDDIRNFSPEMMMTWARSVAVSFDMEKWANEIKEAKIREDLDDETKDEVFKVLGEYIKQAKIEKDAHMEHLEVLKEGLKTENAFADAHDLHVEVARDHMDRLKQAHDEL